MKLSVIFTVYLICVTSCQSQTKVKSSERDVGGRCEGCEALYEYGDKVLTSIDTLPYFKENEPKLKLTGRVYKSDGKTPANDVILYVYHTDRDGIYKTTGDETGWAKRHGRIRGWIKTDKTGNYTFYTFRPGAYPNRQTYEHIHITVKEPSTNAYYIDEFIFNDDPLLEAQDRSRLEDRGGSGIVFPKMENGLLTVQRDILLGKNIPDY